MEKVLLTGGAGFIGSHTLVELLDRGYEVAVVDNLCNSCEEALRRVKKITGKNFKFYNADIRDRAAMEEIFAENKFDSVIHFAGLKAVGESCRMPLEYYDNNIYGTLVLLETMRAHNVKKIVFSSSATVYGTPEKLPLTEECRTGGTTNPYGSTKYYLEGILTDLWKADNEWNVILLRWRRWRAESSKKSTSSATTTRPRTERACATISTSWIWRGGMWRRSKNSRRRACMSTTSARG